MMEEEESYPFVNMLLHHNEPQNVNLIAQNSSENYHNIEFMGDHHTRKSLILNLSMKECSNGDFLKITTQNIK